MNAMTPLDQRRALAARVAMLERCLRAHGLMLNSAPSKAEQGWIARFLDGRSSNRDGHGAVREAVIEAADAAGISPEALLGTCRQQLIAHARQDAMFRASEAGANLSQIARAMRRDHTTISYGVRAARKRREGQA